MGANFGLRWRQTRETVEAFRNLWTEREAAYNGTIVKFPAVRCEPKPVQTGGPKILLGAHGPKALERVARTYDGWMPLVGSPGELGTAVKTLRQLTTASGRKAESIIISPLVDPGEKGPSADELKRYREAGASRIVLLSQKTVAETAMGKAIELIRRFAPTVERASAI
jgi:alkanesulfonate monooxygenase SsuD/methylene tetrahydromethanopterin reductase-like flavin-dependent oxidoreductase (luciferase family)